MGTFVFLSPQDVLFEAKAGAENAYFLVSKRLKYSKISMLSMSGDVVTRTVDHSTWLCEATLWSEWVHVGACEAVTSCQLLAVTPRALLEIAAEFDDVALTTKDY